MIRALQICFSHSLDPYYNLALERQLLDRVGPEDCILYLWQNENTVVIGKSQNAWAECRTSLLEAEGGKLARRLSGGGAVFHDIGNLNFTFLVASKNYDLDKQLSVIQAACALAGIATEKSGRNDLLAGGSKFSGNAFYHSGSKSYHHGTLLIDVNMDKLQRYLSPSKAKLEAKGVASVRSRVVNLSQLSPGLTVSDMKKNMVQAFQQVYGLPATELAVDSGALLAMAGENKSWEFLYGRPLPFTFSCQERFSWGGVELQLEAKNGIIQAARVYSDAMDHTLAPALEDRFTGCRFCLADMQQTVRAAVPDKAEDLCRMLEKQGI